MNRKDNRNILAAGWLCLLLFAERSWAGPDMVTFHFAGQPESNRQRFDVHTDAGLTNLINATDAMIQLSEVEDTQWQVAREQMRAATPVTAMSQEELRQFFSEPESGARLCEPQRLGCRRVTRLQPVGFV